MHAPAPSNRIYRFGLFEADPSSGELLRQGVRVRLQDQPFRLLLALLERPGEVIAREQLRQQLWPADTYVEFEGGLNATLKRLRAALGDSAENPTFIETLPKRGYRFIAPVTTGQDAASVPLAESAVETPLPTPPPRVWKWRRIALLTAIFVVAASAIVASSRRLPWLRRVRQAESPSPTLSPRVSVAVLGFNNASGRPEDAWVSAALSEMLSTELAQGEKLRLVSGEDVTHLRLLAPWPQSGTLGQETSARIGAALSSDIVVLGSYTTLGTQGQRQIRLDVRLQESASGNVLQELAQTGAESDLFRLASSIGTQLRRRLGVPAVSPSEQAEELASLPSNPEAARLYALGITKLRQFDALAAKDLLEQAAELDPKFSLSHAMLARAWSDLGYEQKRKLESKKALELSSGLPRSERMLVAAGFYEAAGDHEKAASTYRALFELFPDNLEYGLALAQAQTMAGHGSQGLQTLAQLRSLPSPAAGDPRIDLVESRIRKEKPAKLQLIRSALQKASSRGTKLVYAAARREECLVLLYSDHPEEGPASCQDAYSIYSAAGNRLGAADCIRLIADGKGAEGKFEEAISTYRRALSILRGLGEHEKTGAIVNNMAINFENEGKFGDAERMFRQAQAHFTESGDQANVATALSNIADTEYLQGHLRDAEADYRKTFEMDASLDPNSPGYELYRLAELQLVRGNISDARKLAGESLEMLRQEQGAYQYSTAAMMVLGEILEAQADFSGARHQYEEALGIRRRIGAIELTAETQASLGELALLEHHPGEAESLVRSAIPEFEKQTSAPNESGAYVLLSRALRAQGRIADARNAMDLALRLSAHVDAAGKLSATIEDAAVKEASSGSRDDAQRVLAKARQQLSSVIMTAKKLGYYRIELEGRLVLGQIELKRAPQNGRAGVQQLQKEAHDHGFEQISREADILLKGDGNIVASARQHL